MARAVGVRLEPDGEEVEVSRRVGVNLGQPLGGGARDLGVSGGMISSSVPVMASIPIRGIIGMHNAAKYPLSSEGVPAED